MPPAAGSEGAGDAALGSERARLAAVVASVSAAAAGLRQLPAADVWAALGPLLADPAIAKARARVRAVRGGRRSRRGAR
jgi:hypothetical protein